MVVAEVQQTPAVHLAELLLDVDPTAIFSPDTILEFDVGLTLVLFIALGHSVSGNSLCRRESNRERDIWRIIRVAVD